MQQLIALRGVDKVYDKGAIIALDQVNLDIAPGDVLAVLGPSGSGKSTLINMMSGFDVPSRGAVLFRGEPVTSQRQWSMLRGHEIGIVFQEFNLIPTLTALENIEVAMFGRGIPGAKRSERARAALQKVGLADRAGSLPYELSGGERQRVAIARSIVNGPLLLLADEPTGNLDRHNGEAVCDLLFEVCRAAALVMVTHNETLARRCARCVRMLDGRLREEALP